MTTLLTIVCLVLAGALVVYLLKSQSLARQLAQKDTELAAAKKDHAKVQSDAEQAVAEAQKLIDQQVADMRAEADRVRAHYEAEARKACEASQEAADRASREAESLRRFSQLAGEEEEVRHTLSAAMGEAAALREQAREMMERAKEAAESDRLQAVEKAKSVYEQADARLNQATRDAGRIVAEAEAKAKEVAGDAYDALRDKQLLERAAEAMRNIVEGYGDRYVVPTHSLLDELAAEFGYTSAGESLKSARAQSRRMVEQGLAATCDYVEAGRRETAVRFVIDAFNGRVDAILSRVKRDNHGVLEQEIRDAFNLVNLNGQAFRDARILDAYLNARLDELKWAVVVQELARRQMEEQRDLKARMRDEEKARKEHEQQMRQAAKEEELRRKAVEEKERELAAARQALEQAAAQDRAALEAKIAEMQRANEGLKQDLASATERALTIAQQTKKGHVYVISNVGSFGEGVYKIGQTRRLNRQDRIDELGDASVPFDFDVHAWIESDNAPVLEHRLQKRFLATQLNKVNSRKEFFRVSLKDIRAEVDAIARGEPLTVAHWTDTADATQYRESQDIESDPQKLEKWLKRQEALADREIRLDSMRLKSEDVAESGSVENGNSGA